MNLVYRSFIKNFLKNEKKFVLNAAKDFFDELGWYLIFEKTCLDKGEEALYVFIYEGEDIVGFCPLKLTRVKLLGLSFPAITSLTNFYSCRYRFIGDLTTIDLNALFSRLFQDYPKVQAIQIDTLEDRDPLLVTSFEGALVEVYDFFGTWFLKASGFSAQEYEHILSPKIQNTIKRQGSKFEKQCPEHHFKIMSEKKDIKEAICEYEAVYSNSWQKEETYPDFMPALIESALNEKTGVVGVLAVKERPIAVQFWICYAGRVTIYKLSYDRDYKAYSPGTLLTLHMMHYFLAQKDVAEIDFGRGDDPYKREWLPERRQIKGIRVVKNYTLLYSVSFLLQMIKKMKQKLLAMLHI